MNTIYKSILFASIGCFALSLNAQTAKDTLFNKKVTVQREYNPTIQDAAKINTTPAIFEPTIIAKDLRFMDAAPRLQIDDKRLGASNFGDINTDVTYDRHKGYLLFNAGNYINLDGAAGYRVVNSGTDKLNFFGSYNSTDAKLDVVKKGYGLKKSKAKNAEADVNLNYEHKFVPSILKIDASFMNMNYNYYGNPFSPADVSEPNLLMNKKQNVDIFNIGAGLKSSLENASALKYDVAIGYTYFKEKYGTSINDNGPKGNIFRTNADIRLGLDADQSIGLKMYIMNQSNIDADYSLYKYESDHNLINTYGIAYFNYEGGSWHTLLGVKAGYVSDHKKSAIFAPEIRAAIDILEKNTFYLNITGGANENTVLDILQENRYVNMMNRVGYSKTLYDLNGGFKLGAIKGMEFELFAGYKDVKKDHLYVTNTYNPDIYSWGNLSNAVYANVSTGSFGALFKTKFIPYTNLYAKLTGYSYSVKYKRGYLSSVETTTPIAKKAWGRPTFTAELNADMVDVVPGFTLSMNYLLSCGRKAYFEGNTVSMKNLNELNFRAEYQLYDWMSINARVNNVLFQKYERIYGYALQDFNFMGGISLRF